MQRIFSILFMSLLMQSILAQFYSTGSAPASIKWEQINTENFQVIFPKEFYDEANRTASILDYMFDHIAKDYDLKPKKISVLLYNTSVASNGYVVWAPKRMEWVTTPPMESYPHDWLEQLALHEFRHVVQLSNLDQGVTKILKILFGEAATGAVSGYLPLWFLEGDAVVSETALSSTGRGRDPNFNLELRTIELDREKRFSYDQSYLGSYKYFTPNYYKYGYHMVTYGKLKYGHNVWKNTINTTGRIPIVAPFYFGIRGQGMKSKNSLYHESFDSLNTLWNNTIDTSTSIVKSSISNGEKMHYTNYKYAQAVENGIFAVRTGIDDITRFILFKDSTEEVIHTPGAYYNTRVYAGKRYICWEEYIADIRWEQQNYTTIKLFDNVSRKEIVLAKKSRLFAPILSPSEERLLGIGIDMQNNYSIEILAIPSGEILKEIELSSIQQAFGPVWLNEEEIAYIALSKEGKKIEKRNITSNKTELLFDAGYTNIDNLAVADEYLLFAFDQEATRNIYSLDLSDKSVRRVTTTRHGADFPSYKASSGELIYSDYTLQGFRPAIKNLESENMTSLDAIQKYEYPWANELSQKAGMNIQKEEIPLQNFPRESYNRLSHSFNLHSWIPFYFDPDAIEQLELAIYPGLTLFSQNKLSTVVSSLSYYYKDGDHFVEPRISLHRFYPVFDLSMTVGTNQNLYYWPENLPPPEPKTADTKVSISSYLPLKLTRNKWHRYLEPKISASYIHGHYYKSSAPGLGYSYIEGSLYGYNLLRQSPRDIRPRFGQSIQLIKTHPLKSSDFFTGTFLGTFTQYLPGIGQHHGINLNIAFKTRDESKFPLGNYRVKPPRGYDDNIVITKNLKGIFEYTLPLFYPDWSVGPLMYIKRFHITAHIDAANISYLARINNQIEVVEDKFYSTGIILGSEMHFLRFFMPFTPKIRLSYLPLEEKFDFGFSINVNTSGL